MMSKMIPQFPQDSPEPQLLTGSHSATCLSLMRLKPVVRIFPSDTNTARTGLEPS